MSELEDILTKIEELREKLNRLTEQKALTSPEVIEASQQLDTVLNQYMKVVKKK